MMHGYRSETEYEEERSIAAGTACALCGFPTHTTEAHEAEYMREHKASISVRAIGKREAGTWTVTEREAE